MSDSSTGPLRQRRELLPSNRAKTILIEFCTQWIRDNSAYHVPTEGAPEAEPNVLLDGKPSARKGDYPLYVRDSFGENDSVDLTTGIVVQRLPFGWQGKSIGQQLHFVRQLDADEHILQGQEFTDTIVMPMVCWCLSKEGLEADDMACTLGFALHAARSILVETGGGYKGLRDITEIGVGTETQIRDQGLVGVPVQVKLELQYLWRVFDLRGQTMKGVVFQMQGDASVKLKITADRS